MKITLYHGSTLSIEHPLAKVGRADLDFGRGFYLTSLRSQAEQRRGKFFLRQDI